MKLSIDNDVCFLLSAPTVHVNEPELFEEERRSGWKWSRRYDHHFVSFPFQFLHLSFIFHYLWIIPFDRDLNEASLLWNLKTRYENHLIYVRNFVDCCVLVGSISLTWVNSIDVHRKHPHFSQPIPYVWHLRSRYGQKTWKPNSGDVITVSYWKYSWLLLRFLCTVNLLSNYIGIKKLLKSWKQDFTGIECDVRLIFFLDIHSKNVPCKRTLNYSVEN